MTRRFTAFVCVLTLMMGLLGGCSEPGADQPGIQATGIAKPLGFQMELPSEGEEFAVIETNYGTIYARLFPDEAPKAVQNFKALAKSGYYDGVLFHRVVKNSLIQTGDPTGTGSGGESVWGGTFEDEHSPSLGAFYGSLAMANAGPNVNGSQFFINQADVNRLSIAAERTFYQNQPDLKTDYPTFAAYYAAKVEYISGETVDSAKLTTDVLEQYGRYGGNIELDGSLKKEGGYTVFGQVFYGMDVVDSIATAETDSNDRPTELICIESITFRTYHAVQNPHVSKMQQKLNTVAGNSKWFGNQLELPKIGDEIAVIHTTAGDMYVRLFPDKAPKAVENFKTLAAAGYYNNVSLDSIYDLYAAVNIDVSSLGADEKSIYGGVFEDEFDASLGNLYGALSMTNSGPDSNSVRFFINNGSATSDKIIQLRALYESNKETYEAFHPTFASYFADRMSLNISTLTDDILAIYEEHGGNPNLDGLLNVSGGNTVFGQVFKGLDVVQTITTVEANEDDTTSSDTITITSIEITAYTSDMTA